MNSNFEVEGKVEIFPHQGGWVYVRVPKEYTEITKDLAQRGLVPITATLGKSTWDTSLLPMGDGTHFIALNAKVRQAENTQLNDHINFTFYLRKT